MNKISAWPVIILMSLMPFAASGSAQNAPLSVSKDAEKKQLAEMGIVSYPTAEDLASVPLPAGAIDLQALASDDINADFSNLGDLRWLERIARDHKVVLLGENHYYRGIYSLGNRMLFALNTYDRYPLLLMELQYSISPFIDHYVGLVDDREAEGFFKEAISGFVSMEEDRERLEHIRRWNKTHPSRRIHVGTYDIEHDYMTTLRNILIPYFEGNGRSWPIGPAKPSSAELEKQMEDMGRTNAGYMGKTVAAPYPFVTPEYIACVIENVQSVRNANAYEFNYFRQRGIVRNLTDPRFHGKSVENGKVFIQAGSYHTPSKFPYPEGANFFREGSYLSYEYGPTKGKTYSLRVEGLTYRLGKMAGVDLAAGFPCGSGYQRLLGRMQKAHREGLLSEDGYYGYADEETTPDTIAFYMLLFKAAGQSRRAPFLVTRADWDGLARTTAEKSPGLSGEIGRMKDEYDRYDSLIFVPQSDVLTLRQKKPAKTAE